MNLNPYTSLSVSNAICEEAKKIHCIEIIEDFKEWSSGV